MAADIRSEGEEVLGIRIKGLQHKRARDISYHLRILAIVIATIAVARSAIVTSAIATSAIATSAIAVLAIVVIFAFGDIGPGPKEQIIRRRIDNRVP
jgi:cytochrome c biogenesis factor